MPGYIIDRCRAAPNFTFEEVARIEHVIEDCDILYITRVQRERFGNQTELYDRLKSIYRLEAAMLRKVKPNLKVLHPLPRVDEIATDVDETPYAYYFQQARNGLLIRRALLALVTGAIQ